MRPIAYLDLDPPLRDVAATEAAVGAGHGLVDIYALPEADLEPYCALIVPMMADQEFLLAHRAVVRAFVDRGRILVFSGHLLRAWIPGAGLFVPKAIRSRRDYAIRKVGDHPIVAGLDEEEIATRRGVAGFFARGHHPVPDGAEVVLTFTSGEPVLYIDRVSAGGTILVHAGNDMVGPRDLAAPGEGIGGRLVGWIQAEAAAIEERRRTA